MKEKYLGFFIYLFIAICFGALFFCSSEKKLTKENSSSSSSDKSSFSYQTFKFKTFIYVDHQGIGIEFFSSSFPTMMGTVTNINWIADYLFSFKAGKGKLDGQSKVFQAIVNSFRLNPQWFNKYIQFSNYLIQNQIQQIRNIGEISRIISQTSNEISDIIMESYNYRQAVNDRISTNFSQMIRGVDEYFNPIEQRAVELPSGYTNAWANSLGEYILSDDPNFNPNVGSTKDWQPR